MKNFFEIKIRKHFRCFSGQKDFYFLKCCRMLSHFYYSLRHRIEATSCTSRYSAFFDVKVFCVFDVFPQPFTEEIWEHTTLKLFSNFHHITLNVEIHGRCDVKHLFHIRIPHAIYFQLHCSQLEPTKECKYMCKLFKHR